MATIRYGMGKTINTGNYENVKLECSMEIDYDRVSEDAEQIFLEAKDFVSSKIEEEEYKWKV